MNDEWFVCTDISQLQAGDIIEMPSKIPKTSSVLPGQVVPFVKHYGIIVIVGGMIKVCHNPFSGFPVIESPETIFTNRTIERIFRTGLSTNEILVKFEQYKSLPYRFFYRNCEDFVRQMAGGISIGWDQRIVYAVLITVIIILSIALLRKK